MNISRDSSVKGDDKKKKKKKKKDKKKGKNGDASEVSEEETVSAPQNVVISRALDMPEGATLSDGDDDRDNLDADDPHRALGDIIFDDYKIEPVEIETRSSHQIEVGGIFAPVDSGKNKKKKREKEKEKDRKEEKKSKKKKEKREKEKQKESPDETKQNKDDAMDMDFWLGSSDQVTNGVGKAPAAAAAQPVQHDGDDDDGGGKEPKKKKKEKKEKKEKKDKKEKKSKKTENNFVEVEDVNPDTGHYRLMATTKDLKISFEIRKVPLDPDKLAAAVQVPTLKNYVSICQGPTTAAPCWSFTMCSRQFLFIHF